MSTYKFTTDSGEIVHYHMDETGRVMWSDNWGAVGEHTKGSGWEKPGTNKLFWLDHSRACPANYGHTDIRRIFTSEAEKRRVLHGL